MASPGTRLVCCVICKGVSECNVIINVMQLVSSGWSCFLFADVWQFPLHLPMCFHRTALEQVEGLHTLWVFFDWSCLLTQCVLLLLVSCYPLCLVIPCILLAWYNHNGWLGVKLQVTYLLALVLLSLVSCYSCMSCYPLYLVIHISCSPLSCYSLYLVSLCVLLFLVVVSCYPLCLIIVCILLPFVSCYSLYLVIPCVLLFLVSCYPLCLVVPCILLACVSCYPLYLVSLCVMLLLVLVSCYPLCHAIPSCSSNPLLCLHSTKLVWGRGVVEIMCFYWCRCLCGSDMWVYVH